MTSDLDTRRREAAESLHRSVAELPAEPPLRRAGRPAAAAVAAALAVASAVALLQYGDHPSQVSTDVPVTVATTTSTTPTTSTAPTTSTPTSSSGPATSTTTAGPAGTRDAYGIIEAESFDAHQGVDVVPTSEPSGSKIGSVLDGDHVLFRDVDFGPAPATQFVARLASGAGGSVSGLVEVRLDSSANEPVGSVAIADTGGWESFRTVPANTAPISGVHDVYVTFTSDQHAEFVDVDWVSFER